MKATMVLLYFCLTAFAYANNLLERQSRDFTVNAPRAGDIFALAESSSDRAKLDIAWTVPQETSDRPVYISLVQGNNITSLDLVRIVNGSAPNNGSYTWYANSVLEGLISGYRASFPSGCNYSIALKVLSLESYSGYFTIVNPEDGGLSNTAECPGEDTQLISEGSGGRSGAGGEASSGISRTTLIIAVTVPVMILSMIIAIIVWYGIRKGLIRKSKQAKPKIESKPGFYKEDQNDINTDMQRYTNRDGVGEMDGNDAPQLLENSEHHELYGSAGRRW